MPLPLSSERLERHGLYLIEDGQNIFLWVGRDAVPQLVMDVFEIPSYSELQGGKVRSAPPRLCCVLIDSLSSKLSRFWRIRSRNESMRSLGKYEKLVVDHTTCVLIPPLALAHSPRTFSETRC